MRRTIRSYMPVLFLVPAIPLVGLLAGGGGGCSGVRGCRAGGGPAAVTDGIATSENYAMPRAEIGTSMVTASSSATYRTTATLGYHLSQEITLSDKYRTYHPLSEQALSIPASLSAEIESLTGKTQAMAPPKWARAPEEDVTD